MKLRMVLAFILIQPQLVLAAGSGEACLGNCADGPTSCNVKCDGDLACIGKCTTQNKFCESECKTNYSDAQERINKRAASSDGSSYIFTYQNPPLFIDEHNTLELSEKQLGKTVGTASWFERKEVRTSTGFYEWKRTDIDVFVERRFQWRRKREDHFPQDTTIELSLSQGYEKEDMEVMEKTIKSTYGAGVGYIDLIKLASNYEDQLKITNSSKEVWRIQNAEKVTQVFHGGKTYAIWQLLEVMNFTFTINEKTLLGTQKNVVKIFPTRIEKAQIKAVVTPYWVDEGDPRGRLQKHSAEKSLLLIKRQTPDIK
ncbi:hypothetical protein PS858_00413 [Pseudomonas fluorescens]|uniref:hypothetical protein n=1 Tax=Pseudomonas fluorescens TaxID=294 RepID=UPI00123F6D61|nr:hypothetical protein [Pseudomonas fluorescens]VVO53695.1 hypothetical protein PS858_00413 [Pseudomonas fluorescens]